MKIFNSAKRTAAAAILAMTLGISGIAHATPNTSSFVMGLSGGSVSIRVNNSEAVDSAEAKISYTGDVSSFNIGQPTLGAFTICAVQTINDVACSISSNGDAEPGTQPLLATIALSPKAGVTTGSITINVTGGSVLAHSDGTETLNKTSLPSVTYSYTAPVAVPTQSSGSSSTSGQTGSTKKTSTPSTSSNTPSSASTSNSGTSTSKTSAASSTKAATDNKKKGNNKAAVATPHSRHTGLVTSTLIGLLIVIAGVYWVLIRKRPEETAPAVYKLDGAGKTTGNKKRTSAAKAKTSARATSTKKSPARKTSKTANKK